MCSVFSVKLVFWLILDEVQVSNRKTQSVHFIEFPTKAAVALRHLNPQGYPVIAVVFWDTVTATACALRATERAVLFVVIAMRFVWLQQSFIVYCVQYCNVPPLKIQEMKVILLGTCESQLRRQLTESRAQWHSDCWQSSSSDKESARNKFCTHAASSLEKWCAFT